MSAEKRGEVPPKQRRESETPQPRQGGSEQAGSQGIVRDQRGQEQPADKERAQRASKGEQGS